MADIKVGAHNNFKLDVTSILYDDPSVAMEKVATNDAQTSAGISFQGLVKLRKSIGFSQIRFMCWKVPQMTIDMTTSVNNKGRAVVNYFTSNVTTRPQACGSFHENKQSSLTTDCTKWLDGTWGSSMGTSETRYGDERLYGNIAGIYMKHFFRMGLPKYVKNPFRCDDRRASESNVEGRWKVFVR